MPALPSGVRPDRPENQPLGFAMRPRRAGRNEAGLQHLLAAGTG
jgi:hypothetical protein